MLPPGTGRRRSPSSFSRMGANAGKEMPRLQSFAQCGNVGGIRKSSKCCLTKRK